MYIICFIFHFFFHITLWGVYKPISSTTYIYVWNGCVKDDAEGIKNEGKTYNVCIQEA